MADNITLNSGTGGDTLAADDVAGVKYQITKLTIGADGAAGTLLTGGSGTTDAGTVRVNLATDVALPAGTNAIGKLAANSGVDIGDVDVTSVPADPFGANADAASATGSISAKLRFIASTGIPITGTVTVGSHAVTNAGTFAVQVDGAALTALQLIDDPVFADDVAFTPATSKVNAVGFFADETATDSVDEGDIGIARMTLDRKQHVVAVDQSNEIRAGGTAVTPAFATVAASSSGDNTIVSGTASTKIRVLSYVIVANAAVNAKWQGSTVGDLTGLAYLAANTGVSSGYNPLGHFEAPSGEDLQLNLSGAVAVGGHITYAKVPA